MPLPMILHSKITLPSGNHCNVSGGALPRPYETNGRFSRCKAKFVGKLAKNPAKNLVHPLAKQKKQCYNANVSIDG